MPKPKRTKWNKVKINRYLSDFQTNVWLSDDTFKTTKDDHNWECLFGHKFSDKFEYMKTRISDVKSGHAACKVCGTKFTREEQIRFCFNQLFGQEFPKKNPPWLRQKNGEPLHFDGFNQDLMLAFEHDGEQHFHHIPYFHPTRKDFEAAQKRDEIKNNLCSKNNVHLLRIKYDVAIISVPSFIQDNLPDELKHKINRKNINWSEFPSSVSSVKFSKLKKHAKQNGGKLLSDEIDADGRVEFICYKHDHQWTASANVVLWRDQWCKHCGHERKNARHQKSWSEEELKSLGQAFEPPLCYEEWAGVDEDGRHLWSCQEPNCLFPFARSPSELETKHKAKKIACPNCNKKRVKKLWEAHKFANEKGGICLTVTGYKNKKSSLKFKCHNKDHENFERTGVQIFDSKMWCPKCPDRKRQKLDREQVALLASGKGFKLLGTYKNNTAMLNLACQKCDTLKSDINYRALERLDQGNNCDYCGAL